MKNVLRLVVASIALSSVGITGCGSDEHPNYSSGVKYGLRDDPILMSTSNDLGVERFDPDRPGLFPVLKFTDILKPESPLYDKSQSILEKEVLRDPAKVPAKERKELEEALVTIFGTPAAPKVDAKAAGLDDDTVTLLKVDEKTLAMGSTRYRVHCLHCHGVPGDGRGPTSRWINPHPRDFRAGKFKFQSINQLETINRPPSRHDLLRTLRSGIEGTAMPSFNLLKDDELESLVSYVIHLNIRGKVEMEVIKGNFEWKKDSGTLVWNGMSPDGNALSVLDAVKESAKLSLHNTEQTDDRRRADWRIAQDPSAAIEVAKYADPKDMKELKASVQRGRMLFTAKPSEAFRKEYHDRRSAELTKKFQDDAKKRGQKLTEEDLNQKITATLNGYLTTGCVSCHVDFGRQAKYRFDDWGTLVRPNNFTLGVFRGGRRPVDLYYRIHSGINGSNMTPFGSNLQGQDIWDLVNFVSSLSYPAMRESLDINID